MELHQLLALVGEPTPTPFDVDWQAVESWLGTAVPADYKEIGSMFGPWYLGDWVWVEIPCRDQPGFPGYSEWLRTTVRVTRTMAEEFGAAELPAFHPKRGGLLPWGKSRSTDRFFWDTRDEDPDRWPVVVYAVDLEPGADPWVHTGLTLVDFLATLVADGLQVSANRRMGPLAPRASRTDYRADALPWVPPVRVEPRTAAARRRALRYGQGLAALRVLAPPPASPRVGEGTWESVAKAVGGGLPSDYLSLMDAYGGGIWRSYLRFPTPLDTSDAGLIAHARSVSEGYRSLREQFPDQFALAVWPEPGGLLAFANTIDGDVLGWLTGGAPDDWPIVVYPRHAKQGPPLETDLLETLLRFMRGQPVPNLESLNPEDDPLDFATFVAWSR